jgi:beta-glucanase (GH16 family)
MTHPAWMLSVWVAVFGALLALAGCSTGNSGAGVASTTNSDDSPAGEAASDGSGQGVSADAFSGGSQPGDATLRDSSLATDVDASEPVDAPDESAIAGWTLTWSDEFNGPDGSAVDPTKWTYDVGGSGCGNEELEYYTTGTQNAVVGGGNLVITATTEGASQYQCSYPSPGTCQYTSARLLTQGLFAQQYGLFEARVQMPTGQGLWPAVWMLGNDIDTVNWPACGEIDFMETIGSDISTNHGSLHMPTNYGPTGTFTLPNDASFADAFHTFAVQWEPGTVRFYVDDQLYETQNQSSVPAGDTWEFDQPFFLLINVAVGGTWPGSPDSTTTFPQTMKVDWVRVYQQDATEP